VGKLEQREMNHESFHDKEELRSVGTSNRKIERKVTPLSSGGLMGNVGTANRKNGKMAPLVLTRGLMATVVTCPGLGEVDKRRHPRVPTHHPLVFLNQQT